MSESYIEHICTQVQGSQCKANLTVSVVKTISHPNDLFLKGKKGVQAAQANAFLGKK